MSIDKRLGMANIDNEPIAGFMDPMVMSYTIKPPATLRSTPARRLHHRRCRRPARQHLLAGERQSHRTFTNSSR